MASFQIHLAVGYVFLKHYSIQNKKDFIRGILDPDFAEDKDISHYTDKNRGTTLKEHLQTKVNLKRYFLENDILTDYQKGVFLHLYTDYEFFHHFFEDSFLESTTYQLFSKNLYYSYLITSEYLLEKYPMDIMEYQERLEHNIQKDLKEKEFENITYQNILPLEKLIPWIEKIGLVNLELEKKKWIS